MARIESRSQLMKRLGAKPQNSDGGWCAVNEGEKKVYLSIWTDSRAQRNGDGRVSYLVQEPHWGICNQTGEANPARERHDDNLRKVFEDGYEAYGYFVVADDPAAEERSIKETKPSFIFSFDLEKQSDGTVLGYPQYRLEM